MDKPNESLFSAIAWIDHPGMNGDFKAQMEDAIESGADVNGFSEDGQTALTAAIEGGMGSPSAVKILLQHGADPDKRDNLGWTPWGTCLSRIEDRVVAEEMGVIKSLLKEANADRSDEVYLSFQKSLLDGDLDAVKNYLNEGLDPNNLMIRPLGCAIYGQHIEIVKLLLIAGAEVEADSNEESSPLVDAARAGNGKIVELLLEYGADITKGSWGDKQATAEFWAREEGLTALADWLLERMPDKPPKKKPPRKYRVLYENNTDGINYDVTTDDIVEMLEKWDKKYSISISDVEQSGFVVSFKKLPRKLRTLAKGIYEFCPDIIEQGYGCMDDVVSRAEASGRSLSDEVLELIDGIDFSDENFGLEILERDLKKQKKIRLWWD
jgi:ankyrin repeat protein